MDFMPVEVDGRAWLEIRSINWLYLQGIPEVQRSPQKVANVRSHFP